MPNICCIFVSKGIRVFLLFVLNYTSLSPIRRGFKPGFVNFTKGCTRLAAASDKAYQLLAHGRWFSPGTPASSKTGRHDIAEILLKVALNTKNQIKSIILTSISTSAPSTDSADMTSALRRWVTSPARLAFVRRICSAREFLTSVRSARDNSLPAADSSNKALTPCSLPLSR